MDSKCSQTVTEIIDELIEACANGAQLRDNGNRTPNEFEQCSDQRDDQSDAGESGHKEIVQEDETSYLTVEVEIFEQFDALEGNNSQTVDINDEIRVMDEKLDREDKAVSATDVEKSSGADCENLIGVTDAKCADNVADDTKVDRQDDAELANDVNQPTDDKKFDREDNAEAANDVKKSAGADCELLIGATDARYADNVAVDKELDRQDNAELANDVKKSAGADCELLIGATDARCGDNVADDDKKLDGHDNAEPAHDIKKSAGADCELLIGATDARCGDNVADDDKKLDGHDNAEPAHDIKKSAGADCELLIGATDARCADNVADDKKLDRQDNAEPVTNVQKSAGADCELLIRATDVKFADNVADDKKPDRQDNAKPETNVKKSAGADTELLKSFSMENYRRITMTNNLSLMAGGNNVPKYEVRCEGLPTNMMEEELVLMFAKFGEVYKLTKLLDKGRIYVTFIKAEDAEKAIRAMDGRTFRGHRIRLYKQLPNKRLIVKAIPKSLSRDSLFALFKSITPTLVSVSVYNDPLNENFIRSFCYLEYPDYYEATNAKDILSSMQIFRTMIHTVEWPDRRFEWKETPDTLFISNIRLSMGSREINAVFSVFGKLVGVSKTGTFASVRFYKVEDAKRAAIEVDTSLLGNKNVEISSFRLEKENSENVKRAVIEVDRSVSGNKTEKISSVHVMPRDELIINSNISDTLYINNVSATLSAADLRKIFSSFGNVLDIDVDRNEGWASVHFPNQEQAQRAVSGIDKRQLGIDVHISFFNNTVVGKASDVLHISNLRSNVMTTDLRKLFTVYGEVMEIDLSRNSAIVHFRNAKDAKTAARSVNRQFMGDGVKISFGERTEKPVVTAENKHEKKPAGTSANSIEKKPAGTSKNKIDQKPATTSANSIEKKRSETSEYKAEKQRLVTSNTLYIYNIYNDMTTRRLRHLFMAYGHVMDINVYAHYASVQFASEENAIRAAHGINRIHLGPRASVLEILFFPKNL